MQLGSYNTVQNITHNNLHSQNFAKISIFVSSSLSLPLSLIQNMLQKMSLLRNAIKSSSLIRAGHQNQGISSFLRNSPRSFSTDAEKPSRDPTPLHPFIQNPTKGLVYGRLNGITTHTTRSDILNLLEGSNLTLDDLKVDYNRSYSPMGMMVHFPSKNAFDAALKTIARNGRLYKLDRIDRAQWDLVPPFDGKALLLLGIPRNALPDDVERFLSGSQYDAASIEIFTRQARADPIRMALVRFPSASLAMNAFLTKNRGFCLNNQVLVRVLH